MGLHSMRSMETGRLDRTAIRDRIDLVRVVTTILGTGLCDQHETCVDDHDPYAENERIAIQPEPLE